MNKQQIIIFCIVGVVVIALVSVFFLSTHDFQSDQSVSENEPFTAQFWTLPHLNETEVHSLSEIKNYSWLYHKNKTCQSANDAYQDYCWSEMKYQQTLITDNAGRCADLTGDFNDRCFEVFAGKRNDRDLCYNINDLTTKNNCLRRVITKVAVQENDINHCDQLVEPTDKEVCVDSLIHEQTIDFCQSDYITTNELIERCQSIIIFNQAMLNNDLSMCNQIPLKEYWKGCFDELGG